MGLENSEIKRDVAEAAGAFAGSFIDVLNRPVLGAEQLAGANVAELAEKKPPTESTAASIGHAAGSITANALMFVGATTALGKIPVIGKAAAYAVGGALGFFEPTAGDQGLGTRFANAALGVGTVGLLNYAPSGLGALKSKWLADTQIGSLLPESKLGQVALANAGIGALNVQADSYIRTGEFAGAGQTLLGSAIWAGTGAGAHKLFGAAEATAISNASKTSEARGFGALREASQSRVDNRAPDVVPPDTPQPSTSEWVPVPPATVRISDLGTNGRLEPREMKVPVDSPTASIYRAAQDGVVRVETMVKVPDGIAVQVASGFAVADARNQVRVITSNHLLTADTEGGELLDISIFDSRGRVTQGAAVGQNDHLDTSVLAVSEDARLKPVKLSDRPIEEVAREDAGFLFAGYPNGNHEVTLLNAQYMSSPWPTVARMNMHTAEEGVCGSGCFSLADGTVAGMYKNATAKDVSTITLAENIDTMIKMTAERGAPLQKSGPVYTRSTYSLDDSSAAKVSFGQILDRKFPDRFEPDFIHSHVVRFPMKINGVVSKLAIQAGYLPADGQFRLRPLVLDDRKLTGDEFWAGTKIPIRDARLTISLNGDTPVHMETVNDPHHVLQQSLNVLDETGYLGNLEPSQVENK